MWRCVGKYDCMLLQHPYQHLPNVQNSLSVLFFSYVGWFCNAPTTGSWSALTSVPCRQHFTSTCRSEKVSFEHNLKFLKEETIFEMSGLDVHPWLTGTIEQHKKNLSAQLNPRNKPVQDSLGTLSCICTLQESFTSTGLFAHDVFLPPLINESGMTRLLENPNMNCDFSNLLLSCASALSNMYILSQAVN